MRVRPGRALRTVGLPFASPRAKEEP